MGSRGTRCIDVYTTEHTEWCAKCQVEFTWVDSCRDGDPAHHPHNCITSLAARVAAIEAAQVQAPLAEGRRVMGDWERRRAVIGLLEITRDALQTADAMLPDDEQATKALKDDIYEARKAAARSISSVPPMPEWVAPTKGPAK